MWIADFVARDFARKRRCMALSLDETIAPEGEPSHAKPERGVENPL